MEHMFGDVPVQVALGDLMQLLPVMSHSLLQALSFRLCRMQTRRKDKDEEDRGG